MEAATLAASIMPPNAKQSTGKPGTKNNSKAVTGVFANTLLALQDYAPTEAQSSPGTTATDLASKTGKDAASNSLLLAPIQLLREQLQSSPNTTRAAGNSMDSGCSGTASARSVAGLSSIISQEIDSLQTSGNAGQVDNDLLADLASLSKPLQSNQASAGNTGPAISADTVDDQATALSNLFKNTDSPAADLLAAVKPALSQTDPGVLDNNTREDKMAVAKSPGILPGTQYGATATASLNSQTPTETGANGLSNPGASLKSSGAPTATEGVKGRTALTRTDRATEFPAVAEDVVDRRTGPAPDAPIAAKGIVGKTALTRTDQATGAPSQSSQDSSLAGHTKEAPVKEDSFVKLVKTVEAQQPQDSSPQSPPGSEEMNSLLAQPSLQQHDLSSLTGLGQTADSKSPTLGASVISQIVSSAHLALNNDNASMKIQLKPEFLGDLKLVVDVERGVVNARFITQNQTTASLIQARLPELKQALNDQGISWHNLSVSSDAGQGKQHGTSPQSQRNQDQTQSDYGYPGADSDAPSTIPAVYRWTGTGAFNYVV